MFRAVKEGVQTIKEGVYTVKEGLHTVNEGVHTGLPGQQQALCRTTLQCCCLRAGLKPASLLCLLKNCSLCTADTTATAGAAVAAAETTPAAE
mmetsp:Transcript_40332/g.120296  ORF Transcript_40332/g.120296 Transcript_40332/m.120296 type:complete len:93 (-) Transcript_40332:55-333(-)